MCLSVAKDYRIYLSLYGENFCQLVISFHCRNPDETKKSKKKRQHDDSSSNNVTQCDIDVNMSDDELSHSKKKRKKHR